MASLKSIEFEVESVRDLVLIDIEDAVWLVVPLRWWDLSVILWWILTPSDKRANVTLTTSRPDGSQVKTKFRAMRVATKHIRVRGKVK